MINPFDFANPVATKEMFIGRETELKDIFFYLDHAKGAPRSINLALLGDRAAGKTSLLNIIEIESRNRGLIPVRINLNEGDAESSIRFWFKLFDAIFTTLAETPTADGTGFIFGGLNGRTYDAYSDIVATYAIPGDKTFCPFQFPLHFARSMAANNQSVLVPEQILQRDLKQLSQEARRLIVLLIDECNVLAANKTLLEMVRNTFMNLPGYMLVFTGTPSLFPVMDEVFSPIVRQFKRITVQPFSTPEETLRAVETPLQRTGMEGLFLTLPKSIQRKLPPELWHHYDEQLQDLHDFTGGRPYEIQLVCHFMFRQIQAGKAKRMRLTYDVLADVLDELGDASNLEHRAVIATVLRLSKERLAALQVLVMVRKGVGVAATVAAARLTRQTTQSYEHVREALDEFLAAGILSIEGDGIRFLGDDFDRIFCKYAARNRGVVLDFGGASPGEMLEDYVRDIFARESDNKTEPGIYLITDTFPLFRSHLVQEASATTEGLAVLTRDLESLTMAQLIRKFPSLVRELYEFCVRQDAALEMGLQLIQIDFESGSYKSTNAYIHTASGRSRSVYESLMSGLRDLEQQAPQVHAAIAVRSIPIEPCKMCEVIDAARSAEVELGRRFVAAVHANRARDLFLRRDNREAVIWHAQQAASGVGELDTTEASNTAFILLTAGLHRSAYDLLRMQVGFPDLSGLAAYNYGVAALCCREFDEAVFGFEKACDDPNGEGEPNVQVMLIPKIHEGGVLLQEYWRDGDTAPDDFCYRDVVNAAAECVHALRISRPTPG